MSNAESKKDQEENRQIRQPRVTREWDPLGWRAYT